MTSARRRRLLGTALFLPLLPANALAQAKALTPSCGAPTARQTEGPFYSPDSPARKSFLEKPFSGEKFIIAGQVLSAQCRPVANALLDFWHADASGEYDNQGFRFRGHQRADEQGRYRLETIVPGEYPGRTRHIHVKVQAPGQRVLTTQLYFPGDPGNRRDGLYRPDLEVSLAKAGQARFDFVVET